MRTESVRTISRFAEEEIRLPDGPYAGQRFSLARSPAARLFFAELETGRWKRVFWTGPNQDGKSLILMIVLCYLLFERGETLVFGVPSEDMAADKWNVDLLPVIRASDFNDVLPKSGAGSKGGVVSLIEFRNGARLRFMTAGGDDQSRSHFTSPKLVVTEVEGFDEVGSSSREGDKFAQLERRLKAFGGDAETYGECTVTHDKGKIWREYQAGTRSRIALRCPHCGKWVTPEREHFHGWQDAENEIQAMEQAALYCPECGARWSNEQRIAANHDALLVHRGQDVDADGKVTGPLPPTRTFSFRWTVVNSIHRPERLSIVATKEWAKRNAADEDAAEKDICQSEWVIPSASETEEISALEWQAITHRMSGDKPGFCPLDTERLVFSVDLNLRLLHWMAVAMRTDGSPHIVEYGKHEVASDELGIEPAMLLALRDLRDQVAKVGWQSEEGTRHADLHVVDSGNWAELVYKFCAESGADWLPTKGFGEEQRGYSEPRQTNKTVMVIGAGCYVVRLPKKRVRLCHCNADQLKAWVHDRLAMPIERPGAMTLCRVEKAVEHTSLAKHLTAEKQESAFVPGAGTVTVFRGPGSGAAQILEAIAAELAAAKATCPPFL
jgi:phage terminase large subunit GpA-like protein